jgi:hypothetical protein
VVALVSFITTSYLQCEHHANELSMPEI